MGQSLESLPFRGASLDQLCRALSELLAEFVDANSRAGAVGQFEKAAHEAGVHAVLVSRTAELIEFAIEQKIVKEGCEEEVRGHELLQKCATATAYQAATGISLARAVLLHTGFEQLLAGLCRIGCVVERDRALSRVGGQKVDVQAIRNGRADEGLDQALCEWLAGPKYKTCLDKWDNCVALFGFPSELIAEPIWRFTRDDLKAFDEARHDAVHGSGVRLAALDLNDVGQKIYRCVLVLCGQVCKTRQIRLYPQAFFGTKALSGVFVT